jgi:serine/threonine protein kinase
MAEPLRRVGRYELLEVIGRGGTAVVYLANQPDLNRNVGLKELSPHHAGDPRFAERFISEARLAAALNHPNIVTVHEFFEHDGLPYISMEYLPRGSLRPYLATLTLPQIFGVAENVLAGLAHGESHSIIHRDLKPENLLVSSDGEVKISDYGVARALNTVVPRPFATMTGTTIGTPAYMAPEQALGEKLGPEADLYSLGIIIWETLAGRPPFGAADTPMAVLYQKIHEPVPRITELEADVDPGFAQWLDVMLAKSPALRFASASAAWDELEEVAIKLLGPRWRRDARITIEATNALPLDRAFPATVTDGPAAPPPAPLRTEPHVQWSRSITPPPATRRISPTVADRAPQPQAPPEPALPPATEPPAPVIPVIPDVIPELGPTPTPQYESEPPTQRDTPAIWGSSGVPADAARPVVPSVPPARPQTPPPFPGDNPAYQTMVRNSRRHVGAHDDMLDPDDFDDSPRRWRRWVVVGLLVVVAAAAGAGLGIKTSPAASPATTRTVPTPEEKLAAAVRPILFRLVRVSQKYTYLLQNEKTRVGQVMATTELHFALIRAQKQLFDLPKADKQLPAASALYVAVVGLKLDWNAAVVAATGKNVAGYKTALKAVTKADPKLADAIAAAEGGLPYLITITAPTTTPTPTSTGSSTTSTG